MNNNLIFDIGFHKGEDTRCYLYRGFNVLAVDAVDSLVEAGYYRFKVEVQSPRPCPAFQKVSHVPLRFQVV